MSRKCDEIDAVIVLNFKDLLMSFSVDEMAKMDEFFVEPFMTEEIDLDYEFDAAKFYDFTRLETEMEAREAEFWFDSAGTYPPSPFVIKLNGRRIMLRTCTNDEFKDSKKIDNVGFELMETEMPAQDENILDIQEIEVKSPVKTNLSRSSTLMKPTASHLAKQKQPPGVYTNILKQRHQKNLGSTEGKNSLNSSIYLSQYTKRQKLEAGFVRKAAQLTHQPLLLHKVPQKDGILDGIATIRKAIVTVPQAPNLATAQRALRRRFKKDEAPSPHSNATSRVYKARSLNRKILEAPMLPLPKKSVPQKPEFQVFNLMTSEKAAHYLSNDLETRCSKSNSQAESCNTRRPSYLSASKREISRKNNSKNVSLCKKILSPKDVDDLKDAEKREKTILKQNTFETQKPRLQEPPVLLFSKLSLRSDSQHNTKSQCSMPMPDKVVNAY